MLVAEQLIRIHEIPTWVVFPFAIAVAAVITATVRWILREPHPDR